MRPIAFPAVLTAMCCISAAPASAQTGPQNARFAQVHALMAGVGPENRITADELHGFLAREVARRTLLSPAMLTRAWLTKQVENLMQQANTDFEQEKKLGLAPGIDANELHDLEEARVRLLPNLATATQAERDAAPTVDFKSLLPQAPARPASPVSLADRLATWLQIRQSFLDEKLVEKPATVSFSTAHKSDETIDPAARRNQWAVAAAVILKPGRWVRTTPTWELHPVLAYEVALSSGLKKDLDSITHRVGFTASRLNGAATVAHGFNATIDYNTDRRYASTVLGGTFQYTPAIPSAGIGVLTGSPAVSFTWRPYLGFAFGDVLGKGARTDLNDKVDFSDLYGKVASRLLFSTRAAILAEVSLFKQLRGGQGTHGFLESSFNLYITPENSKTPVSFQISGVAGRKSPAFKKQQSAKVALAFKF